MATSEYLLLHDDFRNPPYALKALRQCMGFDMENQAWNCVLVVSETGKDGILVSKEPNAERYYMAHIPEHGKLHLPSDLPIEFWTNVCTTNLQLQPIAEINPPKTELENRQQHFASFVGMEMSSLCFALRFMIRASSRRFVSKKQTIIEKSRLPRRKSRQPSTSNNAMRMKC